ncbi:MAG: hypothetical protein AAF549_05645 [Pseudomonadota bacterium]
MEPNKRHTKPVYSPPNNIFSELGTPNTVWAISSVHGELEKLMSIHDAVFERFRPGDRLVYLGNYTGHGEQSRETIEEILLFRRLLLAQSGMKPDDIVYLKGKQEANWHTLMQVQFELFPVDCLLALYGAGMSKTLESYGINPHDGIIAAKEGVHSMVKWVNDIRGRLKQNKGHECFMMAQRRAAYTTLQNQRYPILFVNAGVDTNKSLEDQQTSFWDTDIDFRDLHKRYDPFEKIIRGFDSSHSGVYLNGVSASLDGGCGFGGSLVCASMNALGDIDQLLEA